MRHWSRTPGFHQIPEAEYHAQTDTVSASHLKHLIDGTPAHYRHAMANPSAPTPSMVIGSALHLAILEPQRFEREVAVIPSEINRRTKAGKAAFADWESSLPPGALRLSAESHASVLAMRDRALAHPTFLAALSAAEGREVTVVWQDVDTDAWCKARIDVLALAAGVACDVKTTANASASAFAKSVANFRYEVQAAFYVDGLEAITDQRVDWSFLVVENVAPFECAFYELSEADIIAGRELYEAAIVRLVECQRADDWPGYPDRTITRPRWAQLQEPHV